MKKSAILITFLVLISFVGCISNNIESEGITETSLTTTTTTTTAPATTTTIKITSVSTTTEPFTTEPPVSQTESPVIQTEAVVIPQATPAPVEQPPPTPNPTSTQPPPQPNAPIQPELQQGFTQDDVDWIIGQARDYTVSLGMTHYPRGELSNKDNGSWSGSMVNDPNSIYRSNKEGVFNQIKGDIEYYANRGYQMITIDYEHEGNGIYRFYVIYG